MAQTEPNRSSLWQKCMKFIIKDDKGDVLHATRVTRLLHRLGGYDVYDLERLPGNRVQKSANKFGAWSWLLWCLVSARSVYGTMFFSSKQGQEYGNIYYLNKCGTLMECTMSAALIFYVRVNVIKGQGGLCEFYERLYEIDDQIRKHGVRIDCKDIRMKLYSMAFYQVIFLLLTIMLVLALIKAKYNFENVPFGMLVLIVVKFNALATVLAMFCCSALLLSTRHRYLNDVLRDVLRSDHYEGVLWLTGGAGPRIISQKSAAPDTMHAVGEIFDRIHAAKILENKMFGTTLVLLIGYCFVTCVQNAFYVIQLVKKGPSNDNTMVTELIIGVSLLHITFGIFGIYCVGDYCEQVYSESAYSGWIVHDIINEHTEKETIESARRLSLQLLHQQHKFSANGFFDLDKSLTTSVLQVVATYLVVLLQFAEDRTLEKISEWDHDTNTTL